MGSRSFSSIPLPGLLEETCTQPHKRCVEEERVDPVQEPPVSRKDVGAVFFVECAFEHRLAQVAEGAEDAAACADDGGSPPRDGGQQERLDDQGARDRSDEAAEETLPGLAGRDTRIELAAPEAAAREVGAGIVRPGTRQAERDPAEPLVGRPQLDERREGETRIRRSQHGEADADRRARQLLLEQQRVDERDHDERGQDHGGPEKEPTQGERNEERGQRGGDQPRPRRFALSVPDGKAVQLDRAEGRGDAQQGGERPAAEEQEPDDQRQENDGGRDARQKIAIFIGHRIARTCALVLPKRRSRFWKSSTATRRSSSPKSGQSVSVRWISAYASCQRRKFETRTSPLVRTSNSSGGRPWVQSRSSTAPASTSSGRRVPLRASSATLRAIATISSRPP